VRRDAVAFDPSGDLVPGTTLLEASAGTGKTYQITSVALRLVAEAGVRLPEILIVTFTRAATSELRDRVRAFGRASIGLARSSISALESYEYHCL
jgi:ATP-dependent exoDNAse (exonuclease V) beta subunit